MNRAFTFGYLRPFCGARSRSWGPRFVLLVLLASPTRVRAEIEFSGFIQVGTERHFCLADPALGTSSLWLRLGESNDKYSLVAFDAARDVLSVRADGVVRELRLPPSKVASRKRTVNDSFADVQADRIPMIVVLDRFNEPRHRIHERESIKDLISLMRRAAIVDPYGGSSFPRNLTHMLRMPGYWHYDATTGRFGRISRDHQPVYQIRPEHKARFDALLAGLNPSPPPAAPPAVLPTPAK